MNSFVCLLFTIPVTMIPVTMHKFRLLWRMHFGSPLRTLRTLRRTLRTLKSPDFALSFGHRLCCSNQHIHIATVQYAYAICICYKISHRIINCLLHHNHQHLPERRQRGCQDHLQVDGDHLLVDVVHLLGYLLVVKDHLLHLCVLLQLLVLRLPAASLPPPRLMLLWLLRLFLCYWLLSTQISGFIAWP